MDFSIRNGSFYSGNKEIFLNSGEIHYFRIRRDLWQTHLEAAVEAGLTTVSSYVPWIWHEPEEGLFDFTGRTHAERDLLG
ncbi:MAG TPA: beta-galactosidase, partial [Bacteroidales bacterium]|nr:beta-galactosidase [Bacteroidales bacterium]